MFSSCQRHSASEASVSSMKPNVVAELHLVSASNDEVLATRRLYVGHDLTIGRDSSKCQWVLDDPQLSAKHLRIYTIVYDNEEEGYLEQLVYGEDLSRYGTFWNESLIGRGNGGFLLSHNDKLRLSSKTYFRFVVPNTQSIRQYFDLQQEMEMAQFRKEYVVTDRLLGAGAFGQVFMAIEQNTRTQLACKIVDLRKLSHMISNHFPNPKKHIQGKQVNQNVQTKKIKLWAEQQRKGSLLEEQLKIYYREIDILSQLSHPNIIGLDKVYVTDNTIYMFEDIITAGDLFSYLESKNGRLLEVEAAVIIRQVLIALQFLHDQNIVHRDLKPENIMMTNLAAGSRVVLTDFGAARRLDPIRRMASIVGSEQYTAPELKPTATKTGFPQKGYTKAIDMWSVGAITVVLLTGGSAFSDPSTGAYSPVLARCCNLDSLEKSKEWRQIRPRPKHFIAKLLVLDEQQRMTAQEALRHTWFSNEMHKTDFEELYQRTTKNWYPRVAKSPVVEFIGSSFVRYLAPSQHIIGGTGRKRSRQERKPVEPPYKPFPRNMHIPLWPRRNPAGHIMSDEVKKAIAETWTGELKKAPSRFSTCIKPSKIVPRSEASKPRETIMCKSSASITTNAPSTAARSLTLPVRSMPPPPLKSTLTLIQARNSNEETVVDAATEGLVARNESAENEANSPFTLASKRLQQELGLSANALPRRLSRSSSSVETVPKARKRARNSTFDLVDDDDGDSSDTSGQILPDATPKRQKSAASDSSHLETPRT